MLQGAAAAGGIAEAERMPDCGGCWLAGNSEG